MTDVVSAVLLASGAAVAVVGRPVRTNKRRITLSPRAKKMFREASGRVLGTESGLEEILRLRIALTLLASILGVIVVASSPTTLNVVLVLTIMAMAWQIPLIVARRREARRRRQFEVELVNALGEIVMGVEAGLTLESVLAQYSERHSTSLGSEFRYLIERVRLGVPRVEAVREFEERTPVPAVQLFAAAVNQNHRLGTPLAAVLRQQAAVARRRRRQLVEENSAKLALKMVFPTIFCILPVLLIVIVGPAAIRLIETLPS